MLIWFCCFCTVFLFSYNSSVTMTDLIELNYFRLENKKWIDAHYDPVANLYTFTQCICFSDIHADGDNKLIIADLGAGSAENQIKLKVYKGIISWCILASVTNISLRMCILHIFILIAFGFLFCVCFVLGTTLVTENTIIDLPTGVVTFYMDTHEPRTPGVYRTTRQYHRHLVQTIVCLCYKSLFSTLVCC